jgi:hypothetical protein
MNDSPLTAIYDRWTHPSYEVRVRGTKYLWGSAGLTQNMTFDRPLVLHVRNDLFGETITLGTQVAGGPQTTLGTLDPGECASIPVQDISGVFATCTQESVVSCVIH